jgi:Emfourin
MVRGGALAIALVGCGGAPEVAANPEEPMQVIFQTEGGIAQFPNLSRPVTIDGDRLPDGQGAELEKLLEAARFFDRPAEVGSPARGAADYRRYTITVDAGGRRHTLRLVEPVSDPDLQRLVRFLQAQAKAMRRGGGSP